MYVPLKKLKQGQLFVLNGRPYEFQYWSKEKHWYCVKPLPVYNKLLPYVFIDDKKLGLKNYKELQNYRVYTIVSQLPLFEL